MTWNGAYTVMIKSTTKVVCDAGPIIHLDELNCLDLLIDFQKIILSGKVCEEVKRHRPLALDRKDLPLMVLTQKISPDEPVLSVCRIFSLDAGEIEALAIMQKNPQAIFLTDDASARLAAIQLGFKTHGTIGIIIRSIRQGHRVAEETVRTLTEIPLKSTLHIKPSLLKEIIIKVKNEFKL